jgi:hypothetical protein
LTQPDGCRGFCSPRTPTLHPPKLHSIFYLVYPSLLFPRKPCTKFANVRNPTAATYQLRVNDKLQSHEATPNNPTRKTNRQTNAFSHKCMGVLRAACSFSRHPCWRILTTPLHSARRLSVAPCKSAPKVGARLFDGGTIPAILLSYDTNGDGVFSADEIAKVQADVLSGTLNLSSLLPVWLQPYDANHDGTLSALEWAGSEGRHRLGQAHTARAREYDSSSPLPGGDARPVMTPMATDASARTERAGQ